MTTRCTLVWFLSMAVTLGLFASFVSFGWPGAPDTCIDKSPHECFCEAFDPADVRSDKGGIRQPVNTLFNLYALATSFVVMLFIGFDRQTFAGRAAPNLMRSNSWIADLYIFAVQFLGLGSMWFHASLKKWGGVVDGLSMYVFAAYLVFYTLYRLTGSKAAFWIGYLITVALFTLVHALLVFLADTSPSLYAILLLVAAYLTFEIWIWAKQRVIAQGRPWTISLWFIAVFCILAATNFWALSQKPGECLCDPDAFFQPHGILWHPLAGGMAILLYFYWRLEEPRD